MLLLDVGNTRIKYRIDDGAMQAVAHAGDPAAAVARIAHGATRVAAVDVTGAVATALAGRDVLLLESTAAAGGVVNAYAEPSRLGADRWAALLGARAEVSGPCCVIDAGSAVTADVLAGDGRHLGGWIAPGIELAIAALARGTRAARADAAGAVRDGPATDTAHALRNGAIHAVCGFAVRVRAAAAAALGAEPAVLVCGGDGELVAAATGGTLIDDLVLRGLAAWVALR